MYQEVWSWHWPVPIRHQGGKVDPSVVEYRQCERHCIFVCAHRGRMPVSGTWWAFSGGCCYATTPLSWSWVKLSGAFLTTTVTPDRPGSVRETVVVVDVRFVMKDSWAVWRWCVTWPCLTPLMIPLDGIQLPMTDNSYRSCCYCGWDGSCMFTARFQEERLLLSIESSIAFFWFAVYGRNQDSNWVLCEFRCW